MKRGEKINNIRKEREASIRLSWRQRDKEKDKMNSISATGSGNGANCDASSELRSTDVQNNKYILNKPRHIKER